MKKLTLTVDELAVVSFETVSASREKARGQDFWAWSDDSVCPTTGPSDGVGTRCPI